MTHHNQTKVLTNWFLDLPLDESIDNKKHKVWILNPRHNEAQLEDQKPRKAQEGHLGEGKNRKTNKRHKKRENKQNGKEELKKAQNQNRTSKKSSNSQTQKTSPESISP
jgi:hypothetical protein